MEKYIIYFDETQTSRKYLSTIYRNSTNESKDMGSAIEFDKKEMALGISEYLSKREKQEYRVLCIKTTIEEVKE